MSVCEDLRSKIEVAKGEFIKTVDEMIRLDEQLLIVHSEISAADRDIGNLNKQISDYDSEMAVIKDEAKRREVTDIDAKLLAIEERMTELLFALNGGADTPPASADHAVALSIELDELDSAGDALAARRALLENGSIEPELTDDEQQAVDVKVAGRGDATTLLGDVKANRDQLIQEEAENRNQKDDQFDRQEALVEQLAALRAESKAIGCDAAPPSDPEQPPDPEQPEEPDPEEPADPAEPDPEEPDPEEPADPEEPTDPEEPDPEEPDPEEPDPTETEEPTEGSDPEVPEEPLAPESRVPTAQPV